MSNVVALRTKPQDDARRRVFLETVAASYDAYMADYDEQPDAIVYVLGGHKQRSRVAWVVDGDSKGGPNTMMAMAQAVLMKEILND